MRCDVIVTVRLFKFDLYCESVTFRDWAHPAHSAAGQLLSADFTGWTAELSC